MVRLPRIHRASLHFVFTLFGVSCRDNEYMQVLCTFGIKMLIFFEYMQVWGTSSPANLHILKKFKSFDREKSSNLHILKKIKKNHTLCGTD